MQINGQVDRRLRRQTNKQINRHKNCVQTNTLLSATPGFCIEGLPKILDFVMIWWQSDKKAQNPEAEMQGLIYFGSTYQLYD